MEKKSTKNKINEKVKNIKKGDIIKGSYWPEPLEVKFIEEAGNYIHIVGVTSISQSPVDQLIPKEEFANFSPVTTQETKCSEESWKVFLALENTRYRFASLYDPLLAMNTSKIDPLPHQIEAVYGYVLKLPRIRFLIADDPGAGKTIMAGLIIKELKLRNIIKRILIVAPGHLKDQWVRELSEKFDEKFVPIGREFLDAFYAENVWQREQQVITSIDFIKQEDVLPSVASVYFDLIIVDEAHKMSAYRYGEKVEKTARYKLGELLSRRCDHLLFLTATPHKGDPENFRLFLDLLEPGFFATTKMVQTSIKNKDNPLFIRRVKEDLKDFEGKPLFLPRHVITKTFNLGIDSPNEKDLYNELSRYVNSQYNLALSKDKKRNIAFALVILQRRMASSIYALLKSLERRKKRLQDLMQESQKIKDIKIRGLDIEDVEELSEKDRWKEEEVWETLSVAETKEELKSEISTLSSLIDRAKEIIKNEEEVKLKNLRISLKELEAKYSDPKDKKIIIFTESRDTLVYLERKIKEWGYSTNTIHGGMSLEERVKAEKIFKHETQVLIATEAAGEGINLQFCHLMVNYDIPWNPNRLEQRMGRIHRYGQDKEVYVFNLVAEDTREGKVLNRLFQKLDEIRKALGSDKVFDCLGEVLYDKNLAQLLLEAAANARNIDEILKEIEITVDEEYIAKVKENLGESLATRFIDYTRIKEMQQQAKEHRLIPEYTESFFKKAFAKAGGKIRYLKNGFLAIDSIPYDIRKIAEEDTFKKSFGSILKRYPKVTFDKDIAFKNQDAEFISFGHPLFEALMKWIDINFNQSLLNGATFIDPDGRKDGYILFYEGQIQDGSGKIAGKRLFSFYIPKDDESKITPVSPAIIWDFAETDIHQPESIDIDSLKSKTLESVIHRLEEYKEQLLKERKRQAEIKQKYGINSLEHFIIKLDGDLISLYERKEQGENVDLAIRNKEERKSEYEKAKIDLENQIQKEKNLTMSMPRFVGIIRVKPKETKDTALASDEEIEKIGMQIAFEYEKKHGRNPEDVSSENLGFDIRSTDAQGNIRYIEVKARAEVGDVVLTQNAWIKAKRFGEDYYLYVVLNVSTKPELYIVRNPAQNLSPEERIEVVRYLFKCQEIVKKGKRDEEV
ncbi:MAG: helicase [Candidatus Omnitrophota bacterium]|nr:MAG: helicase [Candidatus Omnitrophota bacterium]